MIKNIVMQAALAHGFKKFETEVDIVALLGLSENVDDGSYLSLTYLSQHEGDKKRFLAIIECERVPSPQELNSLVLTHSPSEFKNDPAFSKNTDLIILFKLDHRADFQIIENKVFKIEENPYYFKKYFLYYSEEELRLISGENYKSLSSIILNDLKFAEYRDDPLQPSIYSISARIFIKLPFVKVPIKEGDLKPINTYVNEALIEKNLSHLYAKINEYKSVGELSDNIIKGLIDEEMESS